ncbi:glycosyltransferase family 4 protein [Streptomyces sulphureus]|uniref:glycosyltransferase family 4 protein n=1 Tax=Streptomyces sulphureus TaxID=47758 RepID=UPI00037365DB|nr:glycosyltransferase family 4 protein [Streptomyces sulphureus]
MRIAFLLDNAYGIGGTIRSTVNLSRALADRHEVQVVSLRRTRETPALPFDPRITLTSLIDLRRDSPGYDGDDPRFHRPSRRFTEGADHLARGISTELGDDRIRECLRTLAADVVIATRPKINDYLAAYGSPDTLRIGQEHLTHRMHGEHKRRHQDAAIAHLDGFVTVSYADAADYRAALMESDTEIVCIPNAVPPADVEPSDGESRTIIAAGRLIKVKRYDRLLRAFALVSEKHPDWRLRIYGRGQQRANLRRSIDELGLYDRAFLMGAHSPLETEWAKGAIAAVSSDAESFGMTIIEAMHCGVPVVSTDCPYGPGEIITNGKDGVLSPRGEEEFTVHAYADGLLHLIEDPGLRRRMSRNALDKAARYAPERIATEYEQLFERLLAERPARSAPQHPPEPLQPLTPGGVPHAAAPAKKNAESATSPPGEGESSGAGAAVRATGGRALRRVPGAPRVRRLLAGVLRPVLRRLRPARGNAQRRPSLPNPSAHVRVARDGGLHVALRTAELPAGSTALVLRTRYEKEGVPEVRLPLPEQQGASVEERTEVVVDRREQRLAEARWDAFVEVRTSAGAEHTRVRVEMVESARLLSNPAPLQVGGSGQVLTPWVPYATAGGFLAVRAWHRDGHAEVVEVSLGPSSCTLDTELYGRAAEEARRAPEGQAMLAGVARGEDARSFELPLARLGTAGADRASASFEVPYDLPGALARSDEETAWDLWFRPAPGARPVRLARLLDDLPDRKKTDMPPRVALSTERSLRLYFSVNNNLVLAAGPTPQDSTPPLTATPRDETAPAGASGPEEVPQTSTPA